MKKTNSWYIGPVIGASSGSTGWPSATARTPLSSRKLTTYVSVMCSARTRAAMTSPNAQITRFVGRSFPHCWLSTEMRAGATSSSATIAKLVGFQRWLSRAAQHVLRRDREHGAQHEGPERAPLRLEEQGEGDPADVRARQVDHPAAVEPGEHRFRGHAHQQRHREPLVAADDVVARLREHQHQGDQPRGEIARVDPPAAQPGRRVARARWSRGSSASALRLGDGHDAVHREMLEHLRRPGRPVDDDAIHPLAPAQSEVRPPVVLAGEAHPAIHDPPLRQPARLDHHLGADRAPVAARAREREARSSGWRCRGSRGRAQPAGSGWRR